MYSIGMENELFHISPWGMPRYRCIVRNFTYIYHFWCMATDESCENTALKFNIAHFDDLSPFLMDSTWTQLKFVGNFKILLSHMNGSSIPSRISQLNWNWTSGKSFIHFDSTRTAVNLNKCVFLSLWLNRYECVSIHVRTPSLQAAPYSHTSHRHLFRGIAYVITCVESSNHHSVWRKHLATVWIKPIGYQFICFA